MAKRRIEVVLSAKDELSGVIERAEEKARGAAERISRGFEAAGRDGRHLSAISKAFEELRKEMERVPAIDPMGGRGAAGSDENEARVEKVRAYGAMYLEERARLASAERAMDEARLAEAEALERVSWENRLRYAETSAALLSNTLQNLFVATGAKHRAMFEAMKAFAIAETVIQTYRAAQGAYAALAPIPVVGPALAIAAAAAAIASGLARVEQIRGTTPEGARGTIGPSGRANPSYAGGSPGAYPVPTRGEAAGPSQHITVQIYNPLSDQNWQKIVEDNIIPAIREAGDRNISLTVRGA